MGHDLQWNFWSEQAFQFLYALRTGDRHFLGDDNAINGPFGVNGGQDVENSRDALDEGEVNALGSIGNRVALVGNREVIGMS